MLIENEFVVPAPVERVWAYLLDVERMAPCMPGAQLTEMVDERTWKGKVAVKLGPVSLSFSGTVSIEDRDDEAHRIVLKASGMEQRGKGAASAVITAWTEEAPEGTKVRFQQDITVSGAVAQYSRGMMQDVSGRLTKQFANCLETNLLAEDQPAPDSAPSPDAPAAASNGSSAMPSPSVTPPTPHSAPAPIAGPPVEGFRLTIWALWRAFLRGAEAVLEALLRAVRSLRD